MKAKGKVISDSSQSVSFIYNIAEHLLITFGMEGGARGSVVVKALCYKPEGHGFDTR
jgi:hypothetical protein